MGLAHGIHGWSDVAVPDMEAGAAFYTALFGWETLDSGPDASLPYAMFTKDGAVVAGMGPLGPDQSEPRQPPAWSSYIIVDDIHEIQERALELGATPIIEPHQIMDAGWMTFMIDPSGAAIGFWQSGTHDGAEVFNEPDTITWNDLATRDVESAKAFYTGLLGWDTAAMPMGEGTYWTISNAGRMNGGVWDMTASIGDDVAPHWLSWFLVSDCRAKAARVTELGGRVVREPSETGIGISAVVADPFGALFGIIETDQVDGQPPR